MSASRPGFPSKLRSRLTILLLLLPSVLIAAVCAYATISYRLGLRQALLEEADMVLGLLVGHRPFAADGGLDRRGRLAAWAARVGQLRQRLPRVRYVALVDASGQDLAAGRLDDPLALRLPEAPAVEPALLGLRAGPPVAHACRPLRDVKGAFVRIGLEAGPLWATLSRVELQAGAILLLGLALNLWMVRSTLRGVIRPLDSLSAQSRALAAGADGEPVRTEGPQEIAELAQAFNEMLARRRADRGRIQAALRELEAGRARLSATNQALAGLNRSLEQKHGEAELERRRFLTMVESLRDGIVLFSAAGRVEYANARAFELLRAGRGELAGRSVPGAALAPGAEAQRPLEHLLGRGRWERLCRQRDFDLRKLALAGAAAGQAGTMILLRDRTQERRLQRQLAEQDKIATIGILAAGVAHEINNPLDGLQNCLRRIVKDPTNSAQIEGYAGLMTASLAHIERVVRQLLNLSHKRDRSLRPIALNQVVRAAVELALAGQRPDRTEIDWQLAPDLPPVLADPQSMTQVFLNLALNALSAMPQGGRLGVRSRREPGCCDGRGEAVVVELSDTGCGIAPQIRGRVFEPFFTTSPQGRGTGLGLTVSRNLVVEHGGEIELDSVPGRGTTFRVRLPRHFAAQRLAAQRELGER